jgi:hypothetical protein
VNDRAYLFTETEKDHWANLFAYIGSEENVRLKFAIDKLKADLDDIVITYGDLRNAEAWESFIADLKGGEENRGPNPPRRFWKNLRSSRSPKNWGCGMYWRAVFRGQGTACGFRRN